MTIAPLQLIFISSLVFGSLYFSQISARSKSDTDNWYSKDDIHMNECINESGCVWINSTWQRLSTSSEAVGFSY